MQGKDKGEAKENIMAIFDGISVNYDEVYLQTLEAKIFGSVTWEHLKQFLPKDKNARILDAGGGTGRWTLPLVQMGYRVVLCDLSKGMLAQAEKKLQREGLLERAEIQVEDITCLSFEDESFDFVICEDGPLSITPDSEKTAAELARVLRRGGVLWTGGVGRYPVALKELKNDPETALKLAQGEQHYVEHKGGKCRVFTPQELEEMFLKNGVTIEKKYGYRIVTQEFPPGYDVVEGKMIGTGDSYDESFVARAVQMELLLSEKPSLLGMAEYIQIVGKKS